jgi:hypothetical protein
LSILDIIQISFDRSLADVQHMRYGKVKVKVKGKSKVVPELLTEHRAMKAYWGDG